MSNEIEQKLRLEAGNLLSSGKVDWIIGFEKGSSGFSGTPLITGDKSDTERLVVGLFNGVNLARYLTEIKGKIGIVARACESRSIVSLIQDKKVKREDVVILGMPCPGIIDRRKVAKLADRNSDDIEEITCGNETVTLKIGDTNIKLALADILCEACLECESPTPAEYDILLGDTVLLKPRTARGGITELERLATDERRVFWEKEFSRCIRCYACRNSCPACFCQRCFVEETEPQWLTPLPRWQENLLFQIVRNIHVAGRCTDCGACERACPVHIPLRSITRKMYDLISDLYHFKAGTDKDAAPFSAHYERADCDDFMK